MEETTSTRGSSEKRRAQLDAWLAEYSALRQEILERMRSAMISVVANVTAIGTIFSVTFSVKQDPPNILLSIPFLTTSFGLYFLNQGYSIADIGHYIGQVVMPEIQRLSESDCIFRWEIENRAHTMNSMREYTYHAAVPLMFVLPSATALVANYKVAIGYHEPMMMTVWWLGVVLALMFLIPWLRKYRYWRGGEVQQGNVEGTA